MVERFMLDIRSISMVALDRSGVADYVIAVCAHSSAWHKSAAPRL
jgi:hypothetical protein